ncbi:hypothetical protein A2755_01665 [Candidatus Wolfebacteria bacterium RIFCSPHIGHO2_01_FULL_48_22]|uniref:Uncharacterized protein n=2 Tax=Candidatus Wolfeibacteriota TaxID=1752735 RepID=A0A1F8DQJ1_9BACT|nr:MAG: hypothetical protein A2755_01665 [Candidatus Wolfebacteria bacterium RIFCSPHIGHO2_01_FULL_48_22]OGM91944.1 MAG: hypothetical protein A2935_02305 [Candidatus Wolfebacteria bacterium RIFCSPLOWO2_01_FULL_47_17b]
MKFERKKVSERESDVLITHILFTSPSHRKNPHAKIKSSDKTGEKKLKRKTKTTRIYKAITEPPLNFIEIHQRL